MKDEFRIPFSSYNMWLYLSRLCLVSKKDARTMKIIDALKPSSVTFVSKKEEDQTLCSNCGRIKSRHDPDQRENCIRARYLKV